MAVDAKQHLAHGVPAIRMDRAAIDRRQAIGIRGKAELTREELACALHGSSEGLAVAEQLGERSIKRTLPGNRQDRKSVV